MKHIHSVSRTPSLAQLPGFGGPTTGINPIESLILVLLTIFFSSYRNFPEVIQNLQKYYSKT
jgi:hypothetical protein